MKHKHEWQFVKEYQIDIFKEVAWQTPKGHYSKFVCECGAFKTVRQFEVKE
jgi:hypothetical protein